MRDEQLDWDTYIFYMRNFLMANALYWLKELHIEGLRVDAVASMLYPDYSRPEGNWTPNIHSGQENLEAVQFLQEMSTTAHKSAPGIVTIADGVDSVTRREATYQHCRTGLFDEVEHGVGYTTHSTTSAATQCIAATNTTK